MPESAPDLYTLATEAKTEAAAANAKADKAIAIAEGAKDAVAGLGHDVRRCTNEVADLKVQSQTHHDETMAAIEGAKRADAARAQQDSLHDQRIQKLESKLTALDLVKISLAGGGGSILVAIVLGVLAMLTGRPLPQQQTVPYAPIPGLVADPHVAPAVSR